MVIAAVLVAVAVLSGGVLFLVVRQQGRLLLRVEAIEQLLGLQNGAFVAHGSAPNTAAAAPAPVGLPVGSVVEPFTLSNLDGRDVSLEDFRGRSVVLINWSPTCGFCDAIAPDLVAAGPRLEEAGTTVVLLAHGDAAANRALAERHGLTAPILLLGDANPAGFQGLGTPIAFAVDADGKVATNLATGANEVPGLVEDVIARGAVGAGVKQARLPGQRDLSTSRLVRDGLKAGTPAPAFTLPDVRGGTVTLEAFRGRRVLLAFSDPDCGPCDALAPHLVRLHRAHEENNLAVILVGRGDLDRNRQKADELGLTFPVVVQDGWKLSREYGIFATPVAFLIGEDGTISRNVAQGVDEIVALVP